MKKWLFAILIGSALVLGACGGGSDDNNNNNENNQQENGNNNEENANNQDTAAAEDVFKNNCASCHGDDLTSGFAPDLDAIGSEYDADEIEDIIKNGKGSMEPVNVADDERAEIAQWLADKK